MNKAIMEKLGFGESVKNVESGLCPFCKKPVIDSDFDNLESLKEFRISGLCQKCQDIAFAPFPEDE